MKKKKRGRPPLKKAIDEIKEFNKKRKSPNYRPDETYPTVEEAKRILEKHYSNRGYKVKGVRINFEGFTVVFKESKKTFEWSDKKKGGGPYGLEKMHISWDSIKNVYQRENIKGGAK